MPSVLVVSACLLITVTAVDITALQHAICSAYGYQLLEAKFGSEVHVLCLKLQPIGASHLTTRTSTLYLAPVTPNEDYQTSDSDIQTLVTSDPLADITMAYGYPVMDPSSGSAEGYIGEDHQFYGVLHIGNRTLHADPYGKDDPHKFFGPFENDNMVAPRSRRDYAQNIVDKIQYGRNILYNVLERVPYFPFRIEERVRVPGVARARICDLLLLADKEFFEKDANSSLNHVVRRMMHAVAQADIIFRNADFNEDGIPDNIGFSVKYILVLTSEDTNTRVFGDLLTEKAIDGRAYLMRFARLRRLSEVCLGVAFSGHAFHNRTLGLSFTSLGGGMGGAAGGLCDRRAYGRSFNTLAIAHATTEETGRVPERIAALTLAHEMGHSFGAHHDDYFPNSECRGYLMGSQSSTAVNGLNFEFSLCSKRLIAATLSSMSYCLIEEDRPYCGNGIVEEGESCDCGLPSRCIHQDPCCTPRSGGALVLEEGLLNLQLKSHRAELPRGFCLNCLRRIVDTPLSNFKFQDCRTQDQECSCSVLSASCRCGLNGRCLPDGSCHAAECATLGLKECQCVKNNKSQLSRGLYQGSLLGELNMCGICCEVPVRGGRNQCIPAEEAAREKLASNSPLPEHWPDENYIGPNVTVRLCQGYVCNDTWLRAWPPGSVCVSQNVVGICSPHGLCKVDYITPRSNVYPDTMNIQTGLKKASRSIKPVSIILISCLVLLCLIK